MKKLSTAGVLLLIVANLSTASAGGLSCPFVHVEDESALERALDLRVVCLSDEISVSVSACPLEQMEYNPDTDITINGFAQGAQDFSSGALCSVGISKSYIPQGRLQFTIEDPFNACGMEMDDSIPGKVTYKNSLRNIGHSNLNSAGIVRRRNFYLPFSCTYPTEFEESGIGPIQPNVPILSGDSSGNDGDFQPVVQLCYQSSCSNVVAANEEIDLLTELFLVVSTEHATLAIIFDDLSVSNTASGPSTYNENLVTDGCLVDDSNYASLTNPGSGGKTYLQFNMFHFGDDKDADIYFHLTYEVCDTDFFMCESPICGLSRRRRASSSSSGNTVSATIGPFKVKIA